MADRLRVGLPSLATAGTGDVLTGIVGGVPREGDGSAARCGRAAVAQQRASVEASQRSGLVASDLLDALPRVLALMHRSELTIDLAALRRNARTLLHALAGCELWAVVKADGYGHGAADVAGAALGAGATGAVRRDGAGGARAAARVLDGANRRHGPAGSNREVGQAREARARARRLAG